MDWVSLGTSIARLGAPVLASVFLGPEAGPLVGALVGKLADAFGVPPTPEAVQNAINTDPAAATKVQEVETAHRDIIEAYLEDMANARAMTIGLAQSGSAIQWGAPVVSIVVIVGYALMVGFIVGGHVAENNLVLAAYGSLSAFAGTVVAFWLGSTKQSADKTEALTSLTKAVVTPAVLKSRK